MSIVRSLSRALILCLPIPILGRYIGGKLVVPALAVSAILAAAWTVECFRWVRSGNTRIPAWALAFVIFLAVGIVSTLLSPYGDLIYEKAAIQVTGIGMEFAAGLGLVAAVRSRAGELASLTRLLSMAMAGLAGVGIVQFLTSNLLGREVVAFEGMNDVAGGFIWASPGTIGSLIRSNAFCSEPAHYGRMLGLAAGPALLRAGFFGANLRSAVQPWIPGWAALTILVGIVMSLSPIAFFGLLATALAVAWMFRRQTSRQTIRVILAMAILAAVFLALSVLAIPEIGEKMGTLRLLGMAFGSDQVSSSVHDLSALTLAANMEVAQENLESSILLGGGFGSHPVVYATTAPVYAVLDLNSEDAASLLIRLLSETGFLGAASFICGCVLVVASARRALAAAMTEGKVLSGEQVCAMGLTGSFVGTLLTYLARMGTYYDPVFWVILGLVAGVAVAPARVQASRPPAKDMLVP